MYVFIGNTHCFVHTGEKTRRSKENNNNKNDKRAVFPERECILYIAFIVSGLICNARYMGEVWVMENVYALLVFARYFKIIALHFDYPWNFVISLLCKKCNFSFYTCYVTRCVTHRLFLWLLLHYSFFVCSFETKYYGNCTRVHLIKLL